MPEEIRAPEPESLEDHPLYPFEEDLMQTWQEAHPNLPPETVARMVRSASQTQERERHELMTRGADLTTADLMTSHLLYP